MAQWLRERNHANVRTDAIIDEENCQSRAGKLFRKEQQGENLKCCKLIQNDGLGQ